MSSQKELSDGLPRTGARLTADEESAIRGAHVAALEHERSQAALAVREVKTLAERSAQGRDGLLAERIERARRLEQQLCNRRVQCAQACPSESNIDLVGCRPKYR